MRLDSDLIPIPLQCIGSNVFYQCDTEGPDWVSYPQKRWILDLWADALFTSQFVAEPEYLQSRDEPLRLKGLAIVAKKRLPWSDYVGLPNIFKPVNHLVYDDAVQDIILSKSTHV